MSVTVINMRQLQNAAGVPAYPDSPPNTIYAEDWNPVRESISKGLGGIWTKGIKLGSDGFETVGTIPFLMDVGRIELRDGSEVDEPVVGFISNDGELGMVKIRADQQLIFGADADTKYEGNGTRSVPETSPTDWHLITQRGAGEVEDFEVFHDGSLEVMRLLQGDFVANKIGSGFVMRFATGLSRIRMHTDGYPVIEDADDFTARPTTWTNERRIMTGVDVFVSDVVADPSSPIVVTEPSADPKVKEVSIANIGAAFLAIGAGASDVNVDALMAGGGGVGSLAQLATPAEVAAITANSAAIAALQAEIATTVKTFRTATGAVITPLSGQILFANSSSTLFDRPAANTIRAVSSGGGGGGGAVDSVTAGNGIENIGTSTNPILQLDLAAAGGLQFNAGEVELAYSGSGGDLGSSGLPARSDHAHAALYSVLAHTHAGFATIGDITFENLDANGDVGTGATQLAAGDDSRLSDARTPLSHDLDSAHAGTLPAGRVEVAYSPVAYNPITSDLEGHLEGLDDKVATVGASLLQALHRWSTNTAASDPGSGKLKADNADYSLVTELYISATTDTGTDSDGVFGEMAAGDSFYIQEQAAAGAFIRVVITGPPSDNGGWWTFPVTHVNSGAAIGNNAKTITLLIFGATPVPGAGEETFTGFASTIALTEKLIGGPVNAGVTVRRSGTVNVARLRADGDLAGGSSITVTISNLTTPASVNIVLGALEQSHEELALGLAFLAGEILDAVITNIGGAPGAVHLQLEIVRE